jgi:RHS repeat-associated protein
VLNRGAESDSSKSPQGSDYNNSRGNKFYEIPNHLGNVLTVINDKKDGQLDSAASVDYYGYYTPQIISAADYYPFGWVSRNFQSNNYRYGFNGKERDDAVKDGEGTQLDYGMRIYDPRVGRFLSVDPLQKKFAKLTPYQFSSNRPTVMVDLDGMEGSMGLGGSANVVQQGYSMVEFDSDGDWKPDYGKGWAAGGLVTFGSGFVILTGAATWPILLKIGVNIASNPRNIYIIASASTITGKYGADAGNFVYGVTTGDANEPFPTNTGSQSADVGAAFRGLFKSHINVGGVLKKAGVETATIIKGFKGDKVAVIGQGMAKVKEVATALKNAEVFIPSSAALKQWDKLLKDNLGKQLSEEAVKGTMLFKENKTWIEGVKKAGYDILDTGGGTTSTFYNMEKETVYGKK